MPATHTPAVRGFVGRARRARQRAARRRGIDVVVHRAGRRQDGGGRVHLALGERRGAGCDPLGAPARRLVPRSPPVPAAGAGRRDHGGISLDAEAGAKAADIDDLFERLEASGRLVRIDPSEPAAMYRGTMLSAGELAAVRQIEDVVRLGHVRRIEADRIVLERGEVETGPGRRCTWIARRSGSVTCRRCRSSSPAESCSSRCGTTRRRSTRPCWASWRPTATTTPTRTASARPTPTPQHRGLAAHGEPHLADGAALAGRARPSRGGSPGAGSTSSAPFPTTWASRRCRSRWSDTSPRRPAIERLGQLDGARSPVSV